MEGGEGNKLRATLDDAPLNEAEGEAAGKMFAGAAGKGDRMRESSAAKSPPNKTQRQNETGLGCPIADQKSSATPATMWYPEDRKRPCVRNSRGVLHCWRQSITSGPNLHTIRTLPLDRHIYSHSPIIRKAHDRIL